ncbi:hypothetical protein [Vibrio crassostreae]|uniref:hypothetical protein n=1 Tax=Vibrio crassostreae TaxID=246167 RepID=UPI001B315ACD|nr:hypothetical protein [Vibrio crassostreae]
MNDVEVYVDKLDANNVLQQAEILAGTALEPIFGICEDIKSSNNACSLATFPLSLSEDEATQIIELKNKVDDASGFINELFSVICGEAKWLH